jgi:protein translocase SecG subunit
MTALLIFLHTACGLLLITVILMQSGRGGGLTEAFASAETIFGPKTNVFMVRATIALAFLFLSTSLVLAHLSSRRGESLIPETVAAEAPINPAGTPAIPTSVPVNGVAP